MITVRDIAGAAAICVAWTARPPHARAECEPVKPVESRFVTDGGTVYDKERDLTWMRCSYGQTWDGKDRCQGPVHPMDWDSAMSLQLPGEVRWRMPTREELQSLIDAKCKKPAIDGRIFPDTALMAYWSSTPIGDRAWHINFRWGVAAWQYLRTNEYAVRLVHSGR